MRNAGYNFSLLLNWLRKMLLFLAAFLTAFIGTLTPRMRSIMP